ncbi:hypothetical protein ES703_69430 [subsurface metagenome]
MLLLFEIEQPDLKDPFEYVFTGSHIAFKKDTCLTNGEASRIN